MKGQPAKILGGRDIQRALASARSGRHPDRNTAIIMLSLRAGLRACEISRLRWTMVIDSRGKIGSTIELAAVAAKKGGGRRIPLHDDLRRALGALLRPDKLPTDPVILSERGAAMTAGAIVNWFGGLYAELGLVGCSSHSGRRTFVTQAARMVSKAGGSLRDVQLLAGHRSIKTTQGYIEGDERAQHRLVQLL